MKFTLCVFAKNPRAYMRPDTEDLGPCIDMEATEAVAALAEAKAKLLEIDAKIPVETACLCTEHTDLTEFLTTARSTKIADAEKATLAKLKAKYPNG